MHFEVPKAKTFKEFGGEYLMIVISILTALALEAVVEKVHHVSQMISAYGSNDGNLKNLQTELERASAAPEHG